jgi:hypothetical protein
LSPEYLPSKSILDTIRENGFYLIPRASRNSLSLKQCQQLLQCNVTEAKKLYVTSISESRPNTLSARFGTELFPLHSDYSLSAIPARYVTLVSPSARPTATLIYDTRPLLSVFGEQFLKRALYKSEGSKRTFYSNLVSQVDGTYMFRYNEMTMIPQNDEAKQVSSFLATCSEHSLKVNWQEYYAVIIDNWRVLHGRDNLNYSGKQQSLWRVTFSMTKIA